MEQMTVAQSEDEIDYTSFYHPNADAPKSGNEGFSKEKDPTRKGQVIDVMNSHNLGTTFFCLIPDKVLTKVAGSDVGVPRLFRKITNAYSGSVRDPDNKKLKMQIQVPKVQDFICELTEEQKKKINKARNLMKNFKDFISYNNRKKYPEISNMITCTNNQQIILTYGKLIKFISKKDGEVKSEEIGHVRVFKFAKGEVGKSDFATVFNATISNKIAALSSSTWMKDYFSRIKGPHNRVVSVNVGQSSGSLKKYTLSATLEEVAPFEINEEDLEIAENLNSRCFDITKFNEDYYDKLLRALQAVQDQIDSMS